MERKEARKRLELMFQACSFIDDRCDGECGTCDKAIDMAISALSVIEQTKWERDTALATLEEHGIGLGQKAEPSDLISRADVIDVISKECWECRRTINSDLSKAIYALPSVSAERVGVWQYDLYDSRGKATCSNCETEVIGYGKTNLPTYCPNCGCRMKGADNER